MDRASEAKAEVLHHIIMATKSLTIPVRGMTCGNCARSVERTLASTPGVTKATVDLNGAKAEVEYDADLVKPEVLTNAVRDLGYEVSDWPVRFVELALDELFESFEERSAPGRPAVDIDYRVLCTDHEKAWRVVLRGRDVAVLPDDGEAADGEARGWGCDVAAWLYGRDPRGGGIVASGDLGVLRLPQWFPFA